MDTQAIVGPLTSEETAQLALACLMQLESEEANRVIQSYAEDTESVDEILALWD